MQDFERYSLFKNKPSYVVAMIRFMSILQKDPVRKINNISLMRAFVAWKDNKPVLDKCDELGRQLQERTKALQTLRDCYLRDVISIKYHLERIVGENDLSVRYYLF